MLGGRNSDITDLDRVAITVARAKNKPTHSAGEVLGNVSLYHSSEKGTRVQ
jgi:hypothetical protein